MPERRTFDVPASADGARVDVFLAAALPGLSRTRAGHLARAGAVTVDGAPTRPSASVAAGATVSVTLPEAPSTALVAAPELPLAILHADAALIVIDKAAGRVVHPAVGHSDDTLVNALVARYPDLAAAFDGPRPGIVHRLDRDTSGVIVVARTAAAAEALAAQFKARTVDKTYLALARGIVSPPEGIIDAPIARDGRRRRRMAVEAGGRASRTAYRVLATLGDGPSGASHSWLVVRPQSGRTHQIRVHLRAIGHPVAGDTVYGRRDRRVPRLALHAWRLAFDHPDDGRRVAFEAPLPADLRAALAALGLTGDPTADAGG